MSVVTAADQALESAKVNIREAIKSLSEIVVEECWGHDDFTEEYQEQIADALDMLLKTRKMLKLK